MLETESYTTFSKNELYEQLFSQIEGIGDSFEFAKYQKDPVGFIKDHLKITLTDDISEMVESVRDNQITVARSATGTGKSHGGSAVAVWFYKCFPNSRVYTTANPFENQKILWSELSVMADGSGLFENDKITTMHIKRSEKDFITALTVPTTGSDEVREGKFSGKHHDHMLFIVDEGDTVPYYVYKGIEGCMSGGIIVRLLILFNPRHEAGVPFRLEKEEESANIVHLSAFNHPNVISGENLITGAVTRETTVRRVNKWCRPLAEGETPDSECFELPAFLNGAIARKEKGNADYPPLLPGWYKIMDSSFSYMVLGEYPAQGETQLINREWIVKARARWDMHVAMYGEKGMEGSKGIGGLDVAEFGKDKNCLIYDYDNFITMPITWGGVDPLVTGDRAADEALSRGDVKTTNVDGLGVGSGTAPQMVRRGVPAISVKVSWASTIEDERGVPRILRDQLAWSVREWLRTDGGATLPPDTELEEELSVLTYTIKNGKIMVMDKDEIKEHLGRSSNKFDALALTRYAKEEYGNWNTG